MNSPLNPGTSNSSPKNIDLLKQSSSPPHSLPLPPGDRVRLSSCSKFRSSYAIAHSRNSAKLECYRTSSLSDSYRVAASLLYQTGGPETVTLYTKTCEYIKYIESNYRLKAQLNLPSRHMKIFIQCSIFRSTIIRDRTVADLYFVQFPPTVMFPITGTCKISFNRSVSFRCPGCRQIERKALTAFAIDTVKIRHPKANQ